MIGDFDIEKAAEEILSESSKIVESGPIDLENPTLDGGRANILVDGNIGVGAAVKGEGSLVVKGSLLGNERWPCRIDVDGDVMILGDAKHAVVNGRSIRIGANAQQVNLGGRKGVEIAKDAEDARVVVGNFEPEKRTIERLKELIAQESQDADNADRLLALEQRRMHKQINQTQFELNFSLGKIILQMRNRIEVDLAPFYKMLSGKAGVNTDNALSEFYAKAVVGLLSRTNLHLIRGNPSRQKIFKTVIRSLHDLFQATRESDRIAEQVRVHRKNLQTQLASLKEHDAPVCVGGALGTTSEIRFLAPIIDDEDVTVMLQGAKLSLTVEDGGEVRAIVTDVLGDESALDSEKLEGIALRFSDEQVTLEGLGV